MAHRLASRVVSASVVALLAVASCGGSEGSDANGGGDDAATTTDLVVRMDSLPPTPSTTIAVPPPTTPPTTPPPSPATTTTVAPPDRGEIWARALRGEFDGASVTVTVSEADVEAYRQSLAGVRDLTGIEVVVDAAGDVLTRLSAGTTDLGVIAGDRLADIVDHRGLVDVRSAFDDSWLSMTYPQPWLDAATIRFGSRSALAGVWTTYQPSKVVVYAPDRFAAAGYAVPADVAELVALSHRIVGDGGIPWCIGIEAGAATGWPVLSWLDSLMLRIGPLDEYDRWAHGDLTGPSPMVDEALAVLAELWFTEGFVAGGRSAISEFGVDDGLGRFVEDPPACWMKVQSPSVVLDLPDGVEYGRDVGAFLLPPGHRSDGARVSIDGDLMVMSSDRPEVRALVAFAARPEAAAPWLDSGTGLRPHRSTLPESYTSAFQRDMAAAMLDVAAVRPPAVLPAPSTTWTVMAEYVAGARDAGQVARHLIDPAAPPPPTLPPEPRAGEIVDLIAEQAIAVSPGGQGITSLDLDIENLLDELLDVEIPAGTYFVAGSGSVQNMVVRTAVTVELQPNEFVSTLLDVACANLERDIPQPGDEFRVERQRSDDLTNVMRTVSATGPSYDVAQAAAWIVTDDADFDDLGILVSTASNARVIDEDEAARAMRTVDESGVDITRRRIWRDRELIAAGAGAEFAQWIAER